MQRIALIIILLLMPVVAHAASKNCCTNRTVIHHHHKHHHHHWRRWHHHHRRCLAHLRALRSIVHPAHFRTQIHRGARCWRYRKAYVLMGSARGERELLSLEASLRSLR